MRRIVELISQRVPSSDEFRSAFEALAKGEADLGNIVVMLVGSTSYENVRRAMRDLEWLAGLSPDLAILLMTGLYAVAEGLFAHDVCDSIELWLENEGTSALVGPIRAQCERGAIATSKAVEWSDMIARNGRRTIKES